MTNRPVEWCEHNQPAGQPCRHCPGEIARPVDQWCEHKNLVGGRCPDCPGQVAQLPPVPTMNSVTQPQTRLPGEPARARKNQKVRQVARADDGEPTTANRETARSLVLTKASEITIRPTHWLMDGRIPSGALTLLAGREGCGKSTVSLWVAAQLTRGALHGRYYGTPRAVGIAASEDSWGHTIVPRLIAAGADLDRVYRVAITTTPGLHADLSLPGDLPELEDRVAELAMVLLIFDPLMSRLSETLDTHKDQQVRQALEPLAAVADRTDLAILALIHVSKANITDPLSLVMGSRAFTGVARSVLFSVRDPDDEQRYLFCHEKSNLGPKLASLRYRIAGQVIDHADDHEPILGVSAQWDGEDERSARDVLEATVSDGEDRTTADEAADWLREHLARNGGTDTRGAILAGARREGFSESTLKRTRKRIGVVSSRGGYPSSSWWSLPGTQPELPDSSSRVSESSQVTRVSQSTQTTLPLSRVSPGESTRSDPTEPTGPTESQSVQSDHGSRT